MQVTYRLNNFKAFKDTGFISLDPITVLCGENSIGKSSILKSLLLLRQSTAERRSRLARNAPTQPLLFNGELTRLGSWSDTVNGRSRTDQISMGWSATGTVNEITRARNYFVPNWRAQQAAKAKFDIVLNVVLRSLKQEAEELSTVLTKFYLKSSKLVLDITEKDSSENPYEGIYVGKVDNIGLMLNSFPFETFFSVEPNARDMFKILKTSDLVFETGDFKIDLEGPFPTSVEPIFNSSWFPFLDSIIEVIAKARVGIRGTRPGWLENLIEGIKQFKKQYQEVGEHKTEGSKQSLVISLIRIISSSFDFNFEFSLAVISPMWKRLRYLGPLRHQPQRFYQFDDTGGVDIGVSGEFTVQVLALEANNNIQMSGIVISKDGKISLVSPSTKTLLDATNEWLELMDLPVVHPNVLQQSLYELQVGSLNVALPDVGFGVSQVLPIIVEALRSSKGDTLILEQPEIHLHPKVQAMLADFFIARAKDGIKFIIESHSEYMIKRLCRRIAEDTIPEVNFLVNIIFVDKNQDKEAACRKVTLNQYGEISNWPAGFFDTQEDLYWTEAALKKRLSDMKNS